MASKYKRFDSHEVPVQRRRHFEGKADIGEEPLRIVLLGKTGIGKSSLANTIFRNQVFEISHTANSATSQCMRATRVVNGKTVSLIDTPGFFDRRQSEEDLKDEIAKCVTECSPGPHAFLILLKVERFTEQEEEVITKIEKTFYEECFKYAVLVFTHGDQLERMKIEDYYHDNNGLHKLLEKCGGRCHVFDNKYWNNNPQDEYRNNQRQIEKLLKTIKEMVENNRGCYSNEMLREVERRIKQEEELIRSSSGNMSQEEVREQAKEKVYNIIKKAAGITTGVLLGALLGVPAMIALVVKILKSEEIPLQALTGAAAMGAASGVGLGVVGAAVAEGAAASGVGLGVVGAAVAEGAAASGVGLGVVGAAVAEGAAASGVVLAVAAGCAAAAGAIVGGGIGYREAEEADSIMEAVGNTVKVLGELVINPVKSMGNTMK